MLVYLKVSCKLAADKAAREVGKWKIDLDDEILQKILHDCLVGLPGGGVVNSGPSFWRVWISERMTRGIP